LYNCLEGGLDANTQQMASITMGCKVGFEQKYVLQLLTAIVTNAWRSFQLLQYGKEIETMTFTKVKEAINRNGTKLKDFVFWLRSGLIGRVNEKIYFMDKITQPRLNGSIIDAMAVLPF